MMNPDQFPDETGSDSYEKKLDFLILKLKGVG